MLFIDEPNLYRCIFQSRKEEAELFQDWVCEEVLPAIRETGGYVATHQEDTPEMIMAKALQIAQSTIDRHQQRIQSLEGENKNLIEANRVLLPKAECTDKVLQSVSTLTTNQIAMELGVSAIKLNKELERRGVQYRQGKAWVLNSKYKDKGYTELRTHSFIDTDNNIRTTSIMVWAERGRQFIHSII